MLVEERPVFPPGLRRGLGERAVEGKEELRGLAGELEEPVGRGQSKSDDSDGRDRRREDAKLPRNAR
jgi:hypothetical protein